MQDENVAGQPDAGPRPGSSNRAGLIAGAAVGLVICAVVGARGGWLLAGGGAEGSREQAADVPLATTARTPSTPPSTPSRTPSRRPSTTAPQIGQMELPNLVGMDFEEAREELLRRGLGVQIVFGNAGDVRTVASTNPRGGSSVKRGITVRVTVVGVAPEVVVPDLVGQSCGQAAERVVDDGLYPRYPTGKKGEVRNQDPTAGAVLRWNEQVALHCSTSEDPTAAPPTP